MNPGRLAIFVGGISGALALSCLPADDRPEPGQLLVTATASAATQATFETSDGWQIDIQRMLAAVGSVRLTGEDCVRYNNAGYTRLFDFTQVASEKVGLVFGLGTCKVEFDVRPPEHDSILGPGTTEADRKRMSVHDTDPFTENDEITLLVVGEARQGNVVYGFEWAFRHQYEIDECHGPSPDADPEGGPELSHVALIGGEARELAIEARPETLFRCAPVYDAATQFAPFAAADANGDGIVTIVELTEVEPPSLDDCPLPQGAIPPESATPPASLAHLVYEDHLRATFAIAGSATCVTERE